MNKKIYHKRGRKPNRDVITPVDGHIYAEHVDGIVKLYVLDGMSIEDIARLYGVGCSNGIGKICRRGKRFLDGEAVPGDERYFKTAANYSTALCTLAAKPGWSYKKIAGVLRLKTRIVREIARRNGLEREVW